MTAQDELERGLALIRQRRFFEAHEVLEDAWRAVEAEERDFFQGLVHVAVAWYQAGRGNRVGCERQLEKAARRLGRCRCWSRWCGRCGGRLGTRISSTRTGWRGRWSRGSPGGRSW